VTGHQNKIFIKINSPYYIVLDPEKNDLSSEGHLTKTILIAVFGIFYIKMNTFQGYSCASSNIDPP
jgi:hypothetical protein